MPIPASLTPITVTARYVKADGSAASGLVRFQLSAAAAVPADQAMVPLASVKATLDAAGSISVVLAATDDPDWAVSGLTYQVTERITGAELRTYNINLRADAPGGTVDLASLAPAVPGPALVSYVLAAAVGAPTGVASLDASGQVPLSQLGNAPAGGGAGAVDSVNEQTGVVVLDAADVGADPAGTATARVAAHVAAADPHEDRAHADAGLAGKASKPTLRRAYITTGDVTLPASAAWTSLAGFELSIPAAVGDEVELSAGFMTQPNGEDQIDWAVLVGAGPAIVRRASTGTATPTTSPEGGDPSMYQTAGGFRTHPGPFGFTVTGDDLDGANVRFALIAKGAGGTKVFASTAYPFRWRAINHGPVLS